MWLGSLEVCKALLEADTNPLQDVVKYPEGKCIHPWGLQGTSPKW